MSKNDLNEDKEVYVKKKRPIWVASMSGEITLALVVPDKV